MPGFYDMHVHPLGAGVAELLECHIDPAWGPEPVARAVARCAAAAKPGDWIVGEQYDASAFGAAAPDRALLDAAAPRNPVVLGDVSGHSVWVNSQVLAAAGIDASTANPAGGVIERGAGGRPTGVLREAAATKIWGLVPPHTRADNARALAWAVGRMTSYGVTSFTDADAHRDELKAYDDLADTGRLKSRVRVCIGWSGNRSGGGAAAIDPIAGAAAFRRARVRTDCVKFFLDGVPLESRTAAFIEPYMAAPGRPADERGLLLVPPDVLAREVARFDRAGMTVKFHAVGDAAVREAIDAIAAARRANGPGGPHHEVAHANFVNPADFRRAREAGATFEFSPAVWSPSPTLRLVERQVGPARMARIWPVREALDAGISSVGGTDWPNAPTPSPWAAVEMLVTREPLGGGRDAPLAPRERITLREAIDLYTRSAALQLGPADKGGSIAPGRWADLVVVDRNPFRIPVTQIHGLKVLTTFIGGEEVYRDDSAGR